MKTRRVEKIRSTMRESVRQMDEIISVIQKGEQIIALSEQIWNVHRMVEYVIMLLKLDLRVENVTSRRINNLPISDPKDQLSQISDGLFKTEGALESKNYRLALNNSRRVRDLLKGVLTQIRRKKT